jgi:hypothetical protein
MAEAKCLRCALAALAREITKIRSAARGVRMIRTVRNAKTGVKRSDRRPTKSFPLKTEGKRERRR